MLTVPGFANLEQTLVVTSDGRICEVSWGGALVGHWGIRIQQPTVVQAGHDSAFLRAEQDIAFFTKAD
jgi:hypothetical protein